jgi:hypothetical protein
VLGGEGVAGVVDGAVVRVAGGGDVCVLVQAVRINKPAQTRKDRFMTIEIVSLPHHLDNQGRK